MIIIKNSIIPFRGYKAMNFFGILFLRKPYSLSEIDINHEAIHTAQMKELAFIFFYVIYFFEWLVRLFINKNAYRSISFEKEAYSHQNNFKYLNHRKHFAQWRKQKKAAQ